MGRAVCFGSLSWIRDWPDKVVFYQEGEEPVRPDELIWVQTPEMV